MQWNSASEFFAMGGYAFYVWGSFGATALVMVVESMMIRARRNAIVRSLKSQDSDEGVHP
jgi:heme exporter protein D